ncbi:hypothetical protein [Blautia sp.]
MLKRFTRYVTQSVAGMIGISVYVLADTFFISLYSGADGLAILNLILSVWDFPEQDLLLQSVRS